ncbi:ATP-binding protein [Acuticoccus kandeliae]|uniref:ATP-binding protein n=1 Tax=Acuticoccus kandeliae TaxID=2073160 RepID=UPI000D3E2D73|nr:ATP-binding protein [Acuticoccus kandeliae]
MRSLQRVVLSALPVAGCVLCAALVIENPTAGLAVAAAAGLTFWRPGRAAAEEMELSSPLTSDARAILDVSPDACIILSNEGTILWANTAAREQLGIFTVGNPISFALRIPDLIRAVEKVGRTGLSERVSWSEKVPTTRWYEAFISACTLAASEGERAIALFVRDLTEQKRLDRMREDFVANASHELRTPLAALTGFIETLQGPARDDPKAREQFLAIMREQADRMKRLTDALLSLSRIEMRAHVRPTDIVDCTETVRYAVEMIRAMAQDHSVALELAISPDPILVRGDSDELVQVIDNLVENAIKYGGDGGRVLISVAAEANPSGPMAVISVEDFGRGIAPEHVPRLTERFYRVDVEESRARQGTGLGLAIVKHIIARHRGRLTVRSELGAGSTFAVRIPLESGMTPKAEV